MTSIADTFDRADSDTLGTLSDGSGSWAEVSGDNDISGNALISGAAGTNHSRADVDLSSDAHYSQVDIVSWSGSSSGGPLTRFSSSANTCYQFRVRRDASNYRLFKYVSGTATQIGSTVSETLPSLPFTARLSSSSGNVHTCEINGVTKLSQTDSSITGNTRAGVMTFDVGGAVTLDNFSAADITAATASLVYFQPAILPLLVR